MGYGDTSWYVTPERDTTVEYEFNRPLTWAERETFRDLFDDVRSHKWLNPSRVRVETNGISSREVTYRLSLFVETRFLNVHPVVAKTIKEAQL